MKNSLLSIAAFVCLSTLTPGAQAQKTQIINGGNPRPQIINGGNPRPQTATPSAPASSSVLPAWVQTLLTVLHLM